MPRSRGDGSAEGSSLAGPTPARLGRRPAHTEAEVIAAAIAIADADGLAAVTMRRIAADIGAGPMSLYTYVADKDSLVARMIDEVSGEQRLPATASGDWRADLLALVQGQRAIMLRHPWLPLALLTRQAVGPHALAFLECALRAFEGTDLDGRARLEVIALLTGFVGSYVSHEIAEAQATRRTGITRAEASDAQARHLSIIAETGQYPHLARAMAAAATQPVTDFDGIAKRMINGLVAGR